MGRIIYQKGDVVSAPSVPIETHICFLDAKIISTLENQLKFFKEKYPNCTFLLSNIDVTGLYKVFPDYDIYPLNDAIIKRFDLNSTIGVVSLKDTKIKKDYFSIDNFKEVKNEENIIN